MEPFVKIKGLVATLDRVNVDTDQIIPKQFLKRIERTGYGQFLFYDWRLNEDGSPNPDFELNAPQFKGASILLTRDNFGCGSSREHAPWALLDYGFHSILAPSFADIFYNNCFKNGMLPVRLPQDQISELFEWVGANSGAQLTVDLESQTLSGDSIEYPFEVDPFRRDCLLKGLNDIDLTLQYEEQIREYEGGQDSIP
jgi:3-isopropylmalate/(R)-2-methylmalate dehydratase small subunit